MLNGAEAESSPDAIPNISPEQIATHSLTALIESLATTRSEKAIGVSRNWWGLLVGRRSARVETNRLTPKHESLKRGLDTLNQNQITDLTLIVIELGKRKRVDIQIWCECLMVLVFAAKKKRLNSEENQKLSEDWSNFQLEVTNAIESQITHYDADNPWQLALSLIEAEMISGELGLNFWSTFHKFQLSGSENLTSEIPRRDSPKNNPSPIISPGFLTCYEVLALDNSPRSEGATKHQAFEAEHSLGELECFSNLSNLLVGLVRKETPAVWHSTRKSDYAQAWENYKKQSRWLITWQFISYLIHWELRRGGTNPSTSRDLMSLLYCQIYALKEIQALADSKGFHLFHISTAEEPPLWRFSPYPISSSGHWINCAVTLLNYQPVINWLRGIANGEYILVALSNVRESYLNFWQKLENQADLAEIRKNMQDAVVYTDLTGDQLTWDEVLKLYEADLLPVSSKYFGPHNLFLVGMYMETSYGGSVARAKERLREIRRLKQY